MDLNEKRAQAQVYANTILHAMVVGTTDIESMKEVASDAWALVDAMEAEERKRTDTTRPAVLANPAHQVDWNDAPQWATCLFFSCEKGRGVVWAELPPSITDVPGYKRSLYRVNPHGRWQKAFSKYEWVVQHEKVFLKDELSA